MFTGVASFIYAYSVIDTLRPVPLLIHYPLWHLLSTFQNSHYMPTPIQIMICHHRKTRDTLFNNISWSDAILPMQCNIRLKSWQTVLAYSSLGRLLPYKARPLVVNRLTGPRNIPEPSGIWLPSGGFIAAVFSGIFLFSTRKAALHHLLFFLFTKILTYRNPTEKNIQAKLPVLFLLLFFFFSFYLFY